MTIDEAQQTVDRWIKSTEKGYFSPLTNTALLAEEVGEVASIMAREYGEQTAKPSENKTALADELADVVWVLLALSNQCGVNLSEALAANFEKKNTRDAQRHKA